MPLDASPASPSARPNIWARSTCPHDCPSTCALQVEVLEPGDAHAPGGPAPGRIGKVRGHPEHPYTAGVICAKVARYAERIHHPDRLLNPLKRVGAKGVGREAFREISWDEALDEVAHRLAEAEARYGSETVWPYFYAGTMGHVQRDGIERLRHAKRWSRQWSTICTTLAESGWLAGVGAKSGVDAREIEKSDLVVVWGGNPVSTQVNVMTWIAKARKARGAKLVVVDPYRTGTAEQADIHLCLKPGTDAALAAAVIHVLLREGLADRDYLARMTDWDAGAEAHFLARPPEWAAPITGLTVEAIEGFARLYGSTKKSFIRVGYGFSRSRNGAASVHAVSGLPAVTGAWAVEGGGALWGNGAIYHLDKTLIEGLDLLDRSVRKLDQSRFGPVMTGDPGDLGDGPPVTALFVQNTNPANVCPETKKCLAGLARDDLFTCVHEQFLTETAAMADIVLPATMFLEHDDFYTASGHTWLQVTQKVVEAPGECRSNHEVICALAKRLGVAHPGFEMTALELIEATWQASGHGSALDLLEGDGWLDCSDSPDRQHFREGFAHPGGRYRFTADWAAIGQAHAGMPPRADYWTAIDLQDEKHPFRLVAAPARSYLNSTFTETPGSRKREQRPTLLIHPGALDDLGAADGDLMRVGNARGSIRLHARAFDGVQPDVVVIESIWPNKAFPDGLGVNTLTSADAGAPRGGAVFHDTAVWIERGA
ncbi:Anaerobic selenocysteine-containing dehydrogenase [Tistlia consotensis]|uniref:Anaerobic selenocysteine-containing dehydrogenase n=1 Tax=Tistlia consotensis USBA 355 TaxID=560819 RepID=A0A1Y6B780_9PROT|nr:molybdopterin oxidoreductase family protein [Tistlia consotensis]SME88031.1 Anaerobic selenocysteine-containing dehydrogenase [Tistlia consotensis USBA 355]SNR24395.1 Anaerobic selenocysteine-containing dehydrogenase [Tistlia consotensis]